MNAAVNLDEFLAFLLDEGVLHPDDELTRGPSNEVTDRARERFADQLRADPEAQITLYLLYWDSQMRSAPTEGVRRERLVTFVLWMYNELGINVLDTIEDNRDRLPEAALPTGIGDTNTRASA